MVEICTEMIMVFLGPVWLAFFVGLIIGWTWKPRWVSFGEPAGVVDGSVESKPGCLSAENCEPSSKPQQNEEQSNVSNLLTEKDFEHLHQLVEMKDSGPPWTKMMDRAVPGMTYQAWRRDFKTVPSQYRSRTVFENATPEIVRDFFWDDEFRATWDNMLAYTNTIDECPVTGTMLVHWIRQFPFFVSDREYIIARQIWEFGGSYYCVSKGVPCNSVPRRSKPRRLDLYYSSWCIKAVKSQTNNDQQTACEVVFIHHEEFGIPWELAKIGVRQGMWGTVKKFEPSLRAYQKLRSSGAPISHHAFMAQITTKVNAEFVQSMSTDSNENSLVTNQTIHSDKPLNGNIAKLIIFGGAILIACNIDRGLLTKTFIFGIGRKFANIGKRL